MNKSILFTAIIALVCSMAAAQTAPVLDKSEIKPVKPTRTFQKSPVTTTSTATSTTPATKTTYALTSAKVRIFTGNDNKEALSRIVVTLVTNGGAAAEGPFSDEIPGKFLSGSNAWYDPGELKINSNLEFPLVLNYSQQDPCYFYCAGLDRIQQYGVRLDISYSPNFILDAWKIDKVELTLEFKDQQGNPHPTLGHKTITFINGSALLTNNKMQLRCTTDGFFMPKN